MLPIYTFHVSSTAKASGAGRSSESYPSERTSMMAESQKSLIGRSIEEGESRGPCSGSMNVTNLMYMRYGK